MKRNYTALLSMSLALAAVSAAAVHAGEAAEGVLRSAIFYDISTMDVAKTTDDYMIPMNIFDRLFETRTKDGTAEVVGSLCTDYTVSEDGLTYDFVLRDGVVFSNGNTLTASDVKYSFERLLKAANMNTEIPLEVAGGQAVMDGTADELEGFTVTDDTHFTVKLDAPNAGFLAELSAPAMSIVDAETMETVQNFGSEPADTIGSGPYIVTEWVTNDHYTLEYNEKYWGDEPSAKKVVVSVIPDANTQNLKFQNGELDLLDLQNQDSAIVESSYKTQYADQLVSTPTVGMLFMGLNENNEYLKDVKVRKAIGMAIDVDMLISGIYSGNGQRQMGIIPSGIWAHNDALEGTAYDPEAAKALLKEAGYGDGDISFEMAMDSNASTNLQLVYQTVSQMFAAVGIKAEIKTYDHSAWLDLRKSGEMDSFIGRWGMDYNDPANIMFTFFGGPDKTKERSLNYPDEEIMARVSAARAIVDDAEREAEYQALEQKIVVEDAAWIPLLEELHLYCKGERVESFTPHWAGFSDYYAADVVLK
ncbi:MAG: ABC transporter substrate-binding protein [Blautia sp.]|nr:ABC transporter substrate-binding protein [Blautia sp.]